MATDGSRGTLLGRFGRGKAEELRVILDEYNGHKFINLRVWYFEESITEWKPGKQGLTIKTHEAVGVAEAIMNGAVKLQQEVSTGQHSGT